MAKELESFTPKGQVAALPDTYWKVMMVALNVGSQTALIEVWGFANREMSRQYKRIGEPKRYEVVQPHYDTYFSHAILSQPDMNPTRAAYEFLSIVVDPELRFALFESAQDV